LIYQNSTFLQFLVKKQLTNNLKTRKDGCHQRHKLLWHDQDALLLIFDGEISSTLDIKSQAQTNALLARMGLQVVDVRSRLITL